ncbi:expressed unknown protein [Seminavis robusta]|uniref:HAT C-terminal dimerisation domain-containing protein n=1 Tax=Seminavis robusta TaxID=568900 RepID=A0A9N8F399_9STRA|nr:expressed unknown protein [Seminavis robusta]|eukprot:Sro4237_g353471.1  (186) ;mRNA; f:514-1071
MKNEKFDIVSVLRGQTRIPVDKDELLKIGNKKEDWIKHVDFIAEKFDIMEWWEDTGKEEFPLLYPIACIVLALPESNGDQERTFSGATWMDGKLNSKQTDITFQMKVLTYKNRAFLRQHRHLVSVARKRVAENRTKRLLREHVKKLSRAEEEGKEPEDITQEMLDELEHYANEDAANAAFIDANA